MNPKLRALIWEHNRVAGIMTLWFLMLYGVIVMVSVVKLGMVWFTTDDFSVLGHFWMGGLGLAFLLRQGASGNLGMRFERRLARLPLDTVYLALVPLGIRCLFMIAGFTGISVVYWLVDGQIFPLNMLLLHLTFYVLAQGFVWSRNYVLYIPAFVTFLVFVVVSHFVAVENKTEAADPRIVGWTWSSGFRVLGSNAQEQQVLPGWIMEAVSEIVSLSPYGLLLFLVFFLLTWQAVRLERCRIQYRLPFKTRFKPFFLRPSLPHGDFESSAAARIWFESRVNGMRLMLFFVGVLTLSFLVIVAAVVIFDLAAGKGLRFPHIGAVELRWYPYLVVAAGAAFIGLTRDFSRTMWPLSITPFTRTKPISAAPLAWAHLYAATRYAFLSILLIFVLTNGVHLLFLSDENRTMVFSVLVHGPYRLAPMAYFAEPLVWACVITWLALGCARPLAMGGAVVVCIDLTSNLLFNTPFITEGRDHFVFLYSFCVLILVRSGVLCYRAWNDELLTGVQSIAFLGSHVLFVLFLWWPGPRDPVVAWDSLFLTVAFSALFLSPLVALPCLVAQKRALA